MAEKTGVLATTVFRVLNKYGYVSQEIYQRVNQAVEELNYCPNQIARSLYLQRTFMIGLFISDISRPFLTRLVKYIETELNDRGHKMMLYNTVEKANREWECLAMLCRSRVDGIIIGSYVPNIVRYQKVSLPIVSIDMRLGSQIPNVTSNHRMGGELAARKLIGNGHKNVVQIMNDRRVKINPQERHRVSQKLMEENGMEYTAFELKKKEFSCEERAKVEEKTFSVALGIDSVFARDYIAARVLHMALSYGIRVSQELKITGYDGTETAELIHPRLTTVYQNYAAISQSIMNALIHQIEQKKRTEEDMVHDVILLGGGTTLT